MPSILARTLRRAQTPAEQKLWNLLRSRQLDNYKFRRQFPIGTYIADFACFHHRLIVEADGGQHAESQSDAVRTAALEKQGWQVIRFWNHEIMENADGVLAAILSELER